ELALSPLAAHRDPHLVGDLVDAFETRDRVALLAREPEALGALAVAELQREDTHSDEVRAVDALERLCDHGAYSEQEGSLRRPVARRARTVLGARDHDQR